jgi:putative transposase
MGSTLTNLIYHVVFSTKAREPMINQEIRDELYRYMGGIIKGEGGLLIQIGGMPDHIRLVLKLRPIHNLSDIMQKIKGSSSKWING